MASAELLLHPVRLRIVEAFLGERQLTTSQLRSELTDVPAASLYRHVARLVDGGVLDVVGERRVRGAIERTYVLGRARTVGADEVSSMTPSEHRRGFLAYVAALIADFDRYVGFDGADPVKDGVSYRTAALWLDDAELKEVALELGRVLEPRLANVARPGRKRRLLRTILMPATEPRPATERPDEAGLPGP